jgi:hypothetical protein
MSVYVLINKRSQVQNINNSLSQSAHIHAVQDQKQIQKHIRALVITNNIPILYIKATVSVCVGSAWKILPVTARSLWSFPECNWL